MPCPRTGGTVPPSREAPGAQDRYVCSCHKCLVILHLRFEGISGGAVGIHNLTANMF
jgi:hypothetical protein